MQEKKINDLSDYERDLWEVEAKQSSSRRIERIFQLYVVVGMLTGLGALCFFAFLKFDISLSSDERLALAISIGGFLIALFAWIFLVLRKQRVSIELLRKRRMTIAAEFLFEWNSFERLGRSYLDVKGSVSNFSRLSVRALIVELARSRVLSADNVAELEELLRFRNSLVHGDMLPDPDTLFRMSEKLRTIVRLVEKSIFDSAI